MHGKNNDIIVIVTKKILFKTFSNFNHRKASEQFVWQTNQICDETTLKSVKRR